MHRIGRWLAAVAPVVVAGAAVVVAVPAYAAPCPDVEVVFARGTFEPPGVGGTGQAFVDSLRAKSGGKTVEAYAVNYPASLDFATADGVPEGYPLPPGLTGPMPASVADHVAAVALFGKPSSGFLQMIYTGAPPIAVGSRYQAKTVDLCIPGDPVCSTGGDSGLHNQYIADGLTDQAADFAVGKLPRGGSGQSVDPAAAQG